MTWHYDSFDIIWKRHKSRAVPGNTPIFIVSIKHFGVNFFYFFKKVKKNKIKSKQKIYTIILVWQNPLLNEWTLVFFLCFQGTRFCSALGIDNVSHKKCRTIKFYNAIYLIYFIQQIILFTIFIMGDKQHFCVSSWHSQLMFTLEIERCRFAFVEKYKKTLKIRWNNPFNGFFN